MTAIIFGANGQDGYYLARQCQLRGIEPIAVSRTNAAVQGDVAHYETVVSLVKQHQPVFVFHVAANSTTSHAASFENHQTIATASLNVLEAVHQHCRSAKVFITGSGVQFVNRGKPIKETDDFLAASPYAVSRIHSVYAARYYRSLGIKTYVGYLFHHESPLRKHHHVSQKIVSAVRRIAAGSGETLELGDVSVLKEWTFAGDVAAGMFQLVEQEKVFEAAIGSGIGYSIQDWLEHCFGLVGRHWRDSVKLTPGFSPEYKCLLSDPSTMNSLGWKAETSIADLAKMMMQADQADHI